MRYLTAAGSVGLLLAASCESENTRQEKVLRQQVLHDLRQHSYATAVPLARQLVKRTPQDQKAWKRLLRAELGLHDVEGAKASLDQWRKSTAVPSSKIEEVQGDIARQERDFAAALSAWRKVAGAQPKNRRVREKIASVEQAQQHWAAAEEAWSSALQIKDHAVPRMNRAVCRRRLHRWDDAFEDRRRAQQLSPDDPEIRRWSKVFDGLARGVEQIKEVDARLEALPDEVGLLCDRALLFLRSEDPELALEDAVKAGKLGPWAMRPRLLQGIALIALNRPNESDKLAIRQPLRMDLLTPEFLDTLSRLDSAIAVEPTNSEHFIARSWQLNEIGQPRLALEDAETASRLDPKSPGALTEQSYSLSKLGQTEQAFETIKQATVLEATFAASWQYRGELEMARGNCLAAVDSFSHALSIQQTVPVLEKREECYRRLGLQARADEDHRAVQQLLTSSFK